MKSISDEEVANRAQRWALLHKNPKNRSKMDALLEGLTTDDQRRVYLCGQRISGGLPLKVIPAKSTGKEETNGKEKETPVARRGRKTASAPSAGNDKDKISVGAPNDAAQSDPRGEDSRIPF